MKKCETISRIWTEGHTKPSNHGVIILNYIHEIMQELFFSGISFTITKKEALIPAIVA
jgi:hypothetical protein